MDNESESELKLINDVFPWFIQDFDLVQFSGTDYVLSFHGFSSSMEFLDHEHYAFHPKQPTWSKVSMRNDN